MSEDFNDEITLRELIEKIKEYLSEVIQSFWTLLFFIAIFLGGFMYQHYAHITKYEAELRFVVEGQSGGSGGLSSLLGSIGIKKGGKVNPYKVIEVGKSTDLLIDVLSLNSKEGKLIIDILIDEYKLKEKWSESDPKFSELSFSSGIKIDGNELQRKALKRIKKQVWGTETYDESTIVNFSLDEDTGVYSIKVNSTDEELSLLLAEGIYDKTKSFFEEEVFINQKRLVDILTIKADSIRILNESKLRQIARLEDSNRGPVNKTSSVSSQILMQETYALTSAYSELVKNKEMTDVNMKDQQPLFMAIDIPFSPLNPHNSSLLTMILKGIFIGGFFATLFILIKKIYRDIMSS